MSEEIFYSDIRGRNLFGYAIGSEEIGGLFRKGDIIIVNPNLPARNGDYVLARKGALCILRMFAEGGAGGALLLAPGNKNIAPMRAEETLIMGRVVERRRSFK